jgi:uncharacterized protein YbaP (TraB family)
MEQQRQEFTGRVNELTSKLAQLTTEYNVKVSLILSLQEIIHKKEDVEKQLDECLVREQKNQDGREKLQTELEQATDYILELEEKVYKANKTSLELLK